MDFMNDYIPIIVGTKLAFSENIFEYKRNYLCSILFKAFLATFAR